MKKLMMLAALFGLLTVSAPAGAHDYRDKHDHHGKTWHYAPKYQPIRYTQVVYPPACYAVRVDWFGHHSRVLRASCRQNAHLYTQVYYHYPHHGHHHGR